jgi:hypothetical protein
MGVYFLDTYNQYLTFYFKKIKEKLGASPMGSEKCNYLIFNCLISLLNIRKELKVLSCFMQK